MSRTPIWNPLVCVSSACFCPSIQKNMFCYSFTNFTLNQYIFWVSSMPWTFQCLKRVLLRQRPQSFFALQSYITTWRLNASYITSNPLVGIRKEREKHTQRMSVARRTKQERKKKRKKERKKERRKRIAMQSRLEKMQLWKRVIREGEKILFD